GTKDGMQAIQLLRWWFDGRRTQMRANSRKLGTIFCLLVLGTALPSLPLIWIAWHLPKSGPPAESSLIVGHWECVDWSNDATLGKRITFWASGEMCSEYRGNCVLKIGGTYRFINPRTIETRDLGGKKRERWTVNFAEDNLILTNYASDNVETYR